MNVGENLFYYMKVAIVILGNSWVCPYVNTYKRILEKIGCDYDVILWDRDGSDAAAPLRFTSGSADLGNPFSKALSYVKYARFIKRTILENGYDRLVVSGPHLAVLLSSFLRKRYKRRYLIDYRDISIEQKPLLYGVYSKVLADSCYNVISSLGFKDYLPGKYEYLISHNFDIENAVRSLTLDYPKCKMDVPIRVLTIGAIRNFESNARVLKSLGNNGDYELLFAGRGEAAERLKNYALLNGIKNAEFTGFYKKEDEASIVEGCSFINIIFPNDVEHSSIMSNRFYLALIQKKPVLVTAGSTQAALVRKYNLGVIVGESADIDAEIKNFVSQFDYNAFCKKCNELLAVFVKEHHALECAVKAFVSE